MLGIDQFPEHMQSCFWNADAYIVIIMPKTTIDYLQSPNLPDPERY